MTDDPLLPEKQFFADITYKNLTGLIRSEDAGLDFYAMKLKSQKATEEGFRRFSWTFADIFIDAYVKNDRNMPEEEGKKLIKKSLDKTWKEYNER